jgi:hypothetical protein
VIGVPATTVSRRFHVRLTGDRGDQDVAGAPLSPADSVEANDVRAENRLHDPARAAPGKAEERILELPDRIALTDPPEISSGLGRSRISREPAGQVGEIPSVLQ